MTLSDTGAETDRPGTAEPEVAEPVEAAGDRLATVLRSIGPVVVGFSGGVDSSLVARAALDALGAGKVLAVTARSASLATGELEHCRDLAASWGLPWRAVDTDEMDDPGYVANDSDRCAHCKDALMDAVLPLAAEAGATVVLGVNVDDLGDHRPGQDAARRRAARFPLVEAGLTKADVRALAHHLDLTVWDRPAHPCLASRIPYGTPVTLSTLSRVDRAEIALRSLGFSDLRVRHLDDTARIEVPTAELGHATAHAAEIVAGVTAAGYRYVTLDLAGLRSGNLNGVLSDPVADNPVLDHTRPDMRRAERIGMPEAVYAAGKTPTQCVEIVTTMLRDGSDPVVVTRTRPEHRDAFDAAGLSPDATWSDTLTWRHAPTDTGRRVAVISGGTSDAPVLDECVGTLTALGADVSVLPDMGVAGLHRLLGSLDELDSAEVIVALAGMEASLPTVLGGLVGQPIVAVPTSTGYGASLEGVTALLSLLSSCAPGITVVGIDNGYGAACAAWRILASPTR